MAAGLRLPVSVFDEVFRERVRLMPGARALVRTMRSWGGRTALVSGGLVPFVEWVRDAIGFDLAQASGLDSLNGHLTGHLLGAIHGPHSSYDLGS
jgi:phosphoserine phosphatase